MAKSLSDLTGKTDSKPKRQPDWRRIQAGEPYSRKELRDEHLTALKPPVKVASRGEAQDLAARYNVKLYPGGPYELRTDNTGQLWLIHEQWHIRAGLWQYQAAPARQQFGADDDYKQRVENAYGTEGE